MLSTTRHGLVAKSFGRPVLAPLRLPQSHLLALLTLPSPYSYSVPSNLALSSQTPGMLLSGLLPALHGGTVAAWGNLSHPQRLPLILPNMSPMDARLSGG